MKAKEQAVKMASDIIEKTTSPAEAIEVAGIIMAAGMGILSAYAKQGRLSDNLMLALLEDLELLKSELSGVFQSRAKN
jgi:hypothetical protein